MDPEGKAIREFLKSPPGGGFHPDGGDLSAPSPRSEWSRWYENAGGFDKAVEMAQARIASDPDPEFHSWDPSALDRSFPVVFNAPETKTPGFGITQGSYRYRGLGTDGRMSDGVAPPEGMQPKDRPFIELHPKYTKAPYAGAQETLDHELGHGVYSPVSDGGHDQIAESPGDNPAYRKWENYVLTKGEIDTRLAGIKRMYAWHKGIIVDTPEQARDALQWYINNYKNIDPDSPDNPEEAAAKGGLEAQARAARLYLKLPGVKQKEVLSRMPKVTQNTPLVERLASYG